MGFQIWYGITQYREPVSRETSEKCTFIRNAIVKYLENELVRLSLGCGNVTDHIKRTDPIRRNKQNLFIVDFIQLTDFDKINPVPLTTYIATYLYQWTNA